MHTFNIMDLGSQSMANGPLALINQNQINQTEGQTSDFFMALLSKLLTTANPIASGSPGLPVDLKEAVKDSKESVEDKSVPSSDQPAKGLIGTQVFSPISLLSGNPDQQGDPEKGNGRDSEKKTDDSNGLTLLTLVTSAQQHLITPADQKVGKGDLAADGKTPIDLTVGTLIKEVGEPALTKTPSSKNGIFFKEISQEEKPVVTDPGLSAATSDLLPPPIIKEKKEDVQVAKSLTDGTGIAGKEMGKEKFSVTHLLDPEPAKDQVKKDGKGHESGNTTTSKDSHTTPLITVDKGAGKGTEKGNENASGVVVPSQGDSITEPASPFTFKVRQDLKALSDQDGLKNKDTIQNPVVQAKDRTGNISTSEINSTPGNIMSPEKIAANKPSGFEHSQRTLEMVLPQGQTFTVKKNSPSSMEVSLEPEGLGKMSIELKVTDHHINAQIMVHDSIGKEIIENHLPQLLSELGKEGIQIGQFSVSLNNQGRDQNPGPVIQTEPRGQPSVVPVVGGSPSISDNHLVHIII